MLVWWRNNSWTLMEILKKQFRQKFLACIIYSQSFSLKFCLVYFLKLNWVLFIHHQYRTRVTRFIPLMSSMSRPLLTLFSITKILFSLCPFIHVQPINRSVSVYQYYVFPISCMFCLLIQNSENIELSKNTSI